MRKRLDIRELGTIEQVVSRDTGIDSMLYVRNMMSNTMNYYYMLGDSLVAELKPIAEGIYSMHTFGISSKSGKEKREFFKTIGAQVLEETGYKEILIFVPEDRRDLRFFLSSFSESVAKTKSGHLIHSFTLEDK